jgi:diguanylate cyclase (GGDEF)-like protein
LPCKHASDKPLLGSICVPLIAQGEVLGMLHLKIVNTKTQAMIGSPEALLEKKQRVAISFAEHIGLSLANLRLRESLRTQAIRDPLTGLFNRRYMEETMERECARVKRLDAPMSLIMMDFDNFKQFNDTYGHNVGDILLRQFGEWLKTQKRIEDIACRFGGEEFILILPGACLDIAYKRAEELRLGVKELQVQHNGKSHNVLSLSLGVAVLPDHGSTSEELIKAADMAMYQAKKEGRDRVILAQSMARYSVDCADKVFLSLQGGLR